jgi:hypothetical protein
MAVMGFVAAVGVAALYSLCTAGHFLIGGAGVDPASGVFGHYGSALTASVVFAAAWFVAQTLGAERWQRLACGIIAVELAIQCWFHTKYTWPSFFRSSQWTVVARDLEQMEPRGTAVFSGDIVQDLSLHAKIHVLPTYYLLDDPTDTAIRDFFVRQNCVPTYFVLVDSSVKGWATRAPAFVSSLEEVARYPLIIGGVGWQNTHVCRLRSRDWLVTPERQGPTPGSPQEKAGTGSGN